MANQPRGRLLQLLIKLRVKANAIVLPANQTLPRFRYYARRFRELQGIINAININYPGEIDTRKIERYGSNISGLVIYLDAVVKDIIVTYSSRSTGSSLSSLSTRSTQSLSSRSTESNTMSSQSLSSRSTQSNSSRST